MRVSPWFIAGLGCLFLFGFFVLGLSLFRLQTVKAGEFAEEETSQTTRRISVPALRGRILDRSGRVRRTAARADASSATSRSCSSAAAGRTP